MQQIMHVHSVLVKEDHQGTSYGKGAPNKTILTGMSQHRVLLGRLSTIQAGDS